MVRLSLPVCRAFSLHVDGEFLFHVSGSAVGRDLYDKAIKKGLGGDASATVTKVATFAVIVLTLLLSLYPPDAVAFLAYVFLRCLGATFLAPFAATLYWKRATTAGIIASMVGGLAATLLWYIFVYSEDGFSDNAHQCSPPAWPARPAFYRDPGLLCTGHHRELGDKETG